LAGIHITRRKILVDTIAGGLHGLAGMVITARALTAQSGTGAMYEPDAISAVVIGGRPRIWNSLLMGHPASAV